MIKRPASDTPKKKSGNKAGAGCMVLFGLPFFLAGLFVISLGLRALWTGISATGWEETSATIQSVELEENHGDDSVSYEVVATYSYHWEGVDYSGDQVDITDGKNTDDDVDHQTYARLKEAHEAAQPVPCFVDPSNPENALLDRELRWGSIIFFLMFGGVFATVGGGIGAAAIVGSRKSKKQQVIAEQNPDHPWLWRDDWKEGVVKASERNEFAFLLLFAAFWNGISWTVMIAAFDEIIAEGGPLLFVLVFPLIGIGLIVATINLWRRARLLGQLEFHFDPLRLPFGKGGVIEGTIQSNSPKMHHRARDLQIGLVVERVVTTKRNNESRTSTKALYSDFSDELDPQRGVRTTDLPVSVIAPTGYEDSSSDSTRVFNSKARSDTHWRVRLQGRPDSSLAKYKASFEVPVFGMAENQAFVRKSDGTLSNNPELDEKNLSDDEFRTLGVERYAQPNGSITYLRNSKEKRSFGLGMTFTALVMIAIGVWVVVDDGGFFGYIFGAIASVFGVIGVGMATAKSAIVIDRNARTLTRIGKFLGVRRQKTITIENLQTIRAESNSEVNGQAVYHLAIRSSEGNTTAIGWLKEHHLASRLAAQILREARF